MIARSDARDCAGRDTIVENVCVHYIIYENVCVVKRHSLHRQGLAIDEEGAMSKVEDKIARAAPEIHMTDIVLPNQTNNENQYDITPRPAGSVFVK